MDHSHVATNSLHEDQTACNLCSLPQAIEMWSVLFLQKAWFWVQLLQKVMGLLCSTIQVCLAVNLQVMRDCLIL